MILVFGGTTEGRKAAEVLEEAGSPYFYSTKTGEQDLTLQHGRRIDGALDAEAMQAFCRARDIRLIVDAAHPFAARLHQTIFNVAADNAYLNMRFPTTEMNNNRGIVDNQGGSQPVQGDNPTLRDGVTD